MKRRNRNILTGLCLFLTPVFGSGDGMSGQESPEVRYSISVEESELQETLAGKVHSLLCKSWVDNG